LNKQEKPMKFLCRLHLESTAKAAFLAAALTMGGWSQTFTTIWNFNEAETSSYPEPPLVQWIDGSLYGTTGDTFFSITPDGVFKTLYSFYCDVGPAAGPTLATNGQFYDTTYRCFGGAYSSSVFTITSTATLTTIYPGGLQWGNSFAPLIQASDGNFYGTTYDAGANGEGSVFSVTPKGSLVTLHSFNGTDGSFSATAVLEGLDGNFYGTTINGGAGGKGTIFRLTPEGGLATLHSFSGPDGVGPSTALIQAKNGDFYGATEGGGTSDCQCGTVFEMTPAGAFRTLHQFTGADGRSPTGLMQANDGNFYGSTNSGGEILCSLGCGTVFKMMPSGKLETLHGFNLSDGRGPGQLMQFTDGTLYGTTYYGGTHNDGTVFTLSVGLGPFVTTLPNAGPIGRLVRILGTNLTGVSRVSFNGTAAAFTVVSGTEITTSVPSGATTGSVEVVTSAGVLTSNPVFRVTN
jgi:uncharacterized repeat protein (TIGR03803 family)